MLGKRGERRHENLIARLEILRDVQQMHRRRPGRGEHDVLHAEVRRQLLLERLALGPEDIVAAFDDFQNAPIDRLALINTRKGYFLHDVGKVL